MDKDREDVDGVTDGVEIQEQTVEDYFGKSPLDVPIPSSNAITPTSLSSKPTTALTLPIQFESSTSETSDSNSEPRYEPTISFGTNDVEGLLSEVLNQTSEWSISTPGSPNRDFDEDQDDEFESEEDVMLVDEEELLARWRSKRKHFFILSSAGKPIYSRHGQEDITSAYMGVMQTIISFFAEDKDDLRSFVAGDTIFVVTCALPLYLVAISSMGESEQQLRSQLDALHMQIISTLTGTQLQKIFIGRDGFDLRNVLSGTENFLNGLADSMIKGAPEVLVGAMECIKVKKQVRELINEVLLRQKSSKLLYGMLVADGRLISVVRPKRHSLHPPDLQLLFSMLFNTSTFRDGNEHWMPLCLPKFNSKGFLHVYVCFIRRDIAVVLVSAEKEGFFEMQECKQKIVQELEERGIIAMLQTTIQGGRYECSSISHAQTVEHFIFKSRQYVQYTMPNFPARYSKPAARRKIMTIYQQLHGLVHGKGSLQKAAQLSCSTSEALAWIAPTFEFYCVAQAGTSKASLAKAASIIVSWVKRKEEDLFIIGGASF